MDVFSVRQMAQQLLKEIDKLQDPDKLRLHRSAELIMKATVVVRDGLEGPRSGYESEQRQKSAEPWPSQARPTPAIATAPGVPSLIPTEGVGIEPPGTAKAIREAVEEARKAWEAAGKPTEKLSSEQEALLKQGEALTAAAKGVKHTVEVEDNSPLG